MFAETDISKVKEYWDSRPCNVRHSPLPAGSREYFDEVERRKYFVEPHIPGFAGFQFWKGKKVLEIGCGIGTDTVNFARCGAKVTAVDLTEASLALARRRAQVYGLDVRFYQADAERLSGSVPVEQYDLVYSFGVIHHTPHPERVIAQIRQYMGPRSELRMMVYHRNSWKVLWILLRYGKGAFWKLDRLIADYSEAQTGCPVTYAYSRDSVKKLLEGFEVTGISVDHIFPYDIKEYKEYRYRKVWYFRWMPAALFRAMERLWGWHLCVTARLRTEEA